MGLKQLLPGSHRVRVIAVVGITQEDIVEGVAHARTGANGLEVWAWCLQPCGPVEGCDRLTVAREPAAIWRDLLTAWPALMITSWTGQSHGLRDFILKATPLVVPPFRAVIRNEANGFFPLKPGPVGNHLFRRTKDLVVASGHRTVDIAKGFRPFLRSLAWNINDRRKGLVLFLRSLRWNTVDRAKGIGLFLSSVVWHIGDRSRGFGLFLASLTWHLLDRIRSEFLTLAAFVAQGAGPLGARLVKRQIGSPAAPVAPLALPQAGATALEITLAGRAWNRAGLLQKLTASTAEFVVIRLPGTAFDTTPLLALATETGAFAVSWQAGYAGWRETALRSHPFRTLQAGEVTEVIAPWSHTTVIRRNALLQLGLPQAITTGAAWMQLFWRASQAGYRSLVVGSGTKLWHEPATQLEDIEFAFRVEPPKPARLHLQRGNVLWAPGHRKPSRGLLRVLVVSPYLPFPLSHGGAVRIYNLCRAMADQVDFTLACFRESGEAILFRELHEVFREVYVVDQDERHIDASVPAQVSEYRNAAMAALIQSLCGTGQVDLLQLEYTQMAEYRKCASDVPVILVEHDITFTLHQQLARRKPQDLLLQRNGNQWLKFETEILRDVGAVWTMSGLDRETAIAHGAKPEITFEIPNGVDLQRFQPRVKTSAEQRILFVGSFRHLPNLLAFECLRETILPAIWKSMPDVKLHVIAGPEHEKAANLAGKQHLLQPDSRIQLEGFVTDVRPAYADCDVVVIPLPVSAGTNIKLMEAMACGRPVVSTVAGCVGLGLEDGRELLVREVGPAFAEGILELLTDESLQTRIAETALRAAEERFGWQSIGKSALSTYAQIRA